MPVFRVLAAIAPKDGAPTVQAQDRTIGEFQNHYTGVNLILYISCRYRNTHRIYATIGLINWLRGVCFPSLPDGP